MPSDFVPTKVAAEILGVDIATVNRWAKDGKLRTAAKGTGPTGGRFFRLRDVEAARSRRVAELEADLAALATPRRTSSGGEA